MKLLTFIVLFLTIPLAKAAPGGCPPTQSLGGSCGAAKLVTEGSSCIKRPYCITGTASGLPIADPSCDPITGVDYSGWMKFTATTTSTTIEIGDAYLLYNNTLPPPPHYPAKVVVAVYTACNAASEITSTCQSNSLAPITFTFSTTVGNTYYVRILRENGGFMPVSVDRTPLYGWYCIYPGTPLSLKWADFSGHTQSNTNFLNWTTASENNTANFQIERSSDAENFIPIGQVAAAGNSAINKNYSFTDDVPNMGTNYYRIKETDRNGSFYFSKTIAINNELSGFHLLKVFPNPTEGSFTMSCFTQNNCNVALQLINMQGKIIDYKDFALKTGYNKLNYSLKEKLSSGSYLIRLINTETGISRQSYIFKR